MGNESHHPQTRNPTRVPLTAKGRSAYGVALPLTSRGACWSMVHVALPSCRPGTAASTISPDERMQV